MSARRRTILVVDDESKIVDLLVRGLSTKEVDTLGAPNAQEALDHVGKRRVDVAILDLNMPGMSGLDLLREIKERSPLTEVLMLTADSRLESGIEAMKAGAYDYLTKPLNLGELRQVCAKALEKSALVRKTKRLETELSIKATQPKLIGKSPAIEEVRQTLARIAPSDSPVLIEGESGTGKEVVANLLHQLSPRAGEAFIPVNCASLQEGLLESELFGHRKGAFTGAVEDRQGLFAVADGGTLFLDEIGEMPPHVQAKLLRVLDTSRYRSVGESRERDVDVRVVAATNRDLAARVEEGTFRQDLYFRLNVVGIWIPPLRERLEDIPLLVDHYLSTRRGGFRGEAPLRLSPDLIPVMESYSWPGNVRELINYLERACLLCTGGVLRLEDPRTSLINRGLAQIGAAVSGAVTGGSEGAPPAGAAGDAITLEQLERYHIEAILQRTGGNVTEAARRLGINRRTLHRKLKQYEGA